MPPGGQPGGGTSPNNIAPGGTGCSAGGGPSPKTSIITNNQQQRPSDSSSKTNTTGSVPVNNGHDLKSVVVEKPVNNAVSVSGVSAASADVTTKAKVVTASVEPSPKTSSEEKQPLILERPKRISFCNDPISTTLEAANVNHTLNHQNNHKSAKIEDNPVTNLPKISPEKSAAQLQSSVSSSSPAPPVISPSLSPTSPCSNILKKDDIHSMSPGTPCSQCLRETASNGGPNIKMAVSPSNSSTRQNGGHEFFGSSEECCSSWSGCCNSSCAGSCGDQQPSTQQSKQQTQLPVQLPVGPLASNSSPVEQQQPLLVMQSQTPDSGGKLCSKLSISTGNDIDIGVATISCTKFEEVVGNPRRNGSSRLLSKISRSVPEDLPGEMLVDGANQRHLVTFVTPSMETIPLEMCQDIPDVLI